MDEHPTPHTYQQAADALGIEAEAVRARLRQGALRRGPLTNDQRPTVLLSPAEIAAIRAGVRTRPAESTSDSGPDSAGRPDETDRTISALEAAALRERAARAEGESATLRERMESAETRADRAEVEREVARAEAAAERARAAQAEREREAAKVAAASAEGEAKGLRLALEEAQKPFWKRLLG